MTRNITKYTLLACILLTLGLLPACKKDNADIHDASMPVVVNKFYPTKGGSGTEILITGKNFTGDTANVTVTIGGMPVKVLSCNSTGIMVVVPKKCKSGLIEVKIGNSTESTSVEPFVYTTTRTITTLAGNGTPGFANGKGKDAQFNFSNPAWMRSAGIAVDDKLNVFVADPGNHCIRKIDSAGNVTVFVGNPIASGYADGKGLAANFAIPYGLALDAQGSLYSSDPANWDIRKITPDGTATTIAWGSAAPWFVAVDPTTQKVYYATQDAGTVVCTDGTKILSGLTESGDIVFDKQGNLYLSGYNTNLIKKYAAGTWAGTTIAGTGVFGYADGAGSVAQFASPWGIAVDNDNNLYIAGNSYGWHTPDESIRFIEAGTWKVSTFAGSGTAGYADGMGTAALFQSPSGVAVDKNGTVYVLDKMNNCIRKIVSE
ncbi:IPT/TIG domain-containing protein [Chitinophagaceae bacterium 26-R-25]|nr:IPT/TIG domain-containing protein [Chitinophagaceae bacterium 26-R-25]